MSRKNQTQICLATVVATLGVAVLIGLRVVNYQNANRQLIASIRNHKADAALQAVAQGANANVRDYSDVTANAPPSRSWRDSLDHLLHPNARQPDASAPTALQILLQSFPAHYQRCPENVALVKALLDRGAWVNLHDDFGETPLLGASGSGYRDTVRLLLEHGAHVNVQTQNGDTPLLWAASEQTEIARMLLAKGANVNVQNNRDETPLFLACVSGNEANVALFLEHGAQVQVTDQDGQTPLHWAAMRCHTATVKRLLEVGASLHARDGVGTTVLMDAAEEGRLETMRLLVQKGADVNAVDQFGWTAWTHAACGKERLACQLLVKYGAKAGPLP